MWPIRFYELWPKYFKVRQKTIDINRTKAHSPENIEKWYEMFRQALKHYGIEEDDFWNVDETSFIIGIEKDRWVLTRDTTRLSYLGSSSSRELVTVVESIGSMVTFLGQDHQEHW
jgi:hypothetical protein